MNPSLKNFFISSLNKLGTSPKKANFEEIPSDGSSRNFWRISVNESTTSYIGMANRPANQSLSRENYSYLMIGRHLLEKGIPVPTIHRFDLEQGWFFMEDLGKGTLQDTFFIEPDPLPFYKDVVELAFTMQTEGARNFDSKWCCQTNRYNQKVMMEYESHYFRDAFLDNYLGLKKHSAELEKAFQYLYETIARSDTGYFMHRDFQSRNILVKNGRIGIIDWQGGRYGPLEYDLASLLIDPYTNLTPSFRDKIYKHYLDTLNTKTSNLKNSFESFFPYVAIQRTLQILGAFSFLTKNKGKKQFEQHIPTALKILSDLLHDVDDKKLTTLKSLIDEILSFRTIT